MLVHFPFSDLSGRKLRPAVVLASADADDWILCQVTSNPYADAQSVCLDDASFAQGSLRRLSFARPGKLFTANSTLIAGVAGSLSTEAFQEVRQAVVALLSGE